ncbi:fibronectin type III domain-containing protein [Chloroflexi bacterium TSY]|nr:fibronectin type III domain-containing protein [Chloroflexi bacterium TSY]
MNNTNWLVRNVTVSICDWYGVTCGDGHVTELLLSANGLKGKLPLEIGRLANLKTLHLENNLLNGKLPRSICQLEATVVDANFAYNGLYSRHSRVKECMAKLDPNWSDTQTTPPRNLAITNITAESVTLTWDPIPYIDDSGGYEIGLADQFGGPYTLHGQTSSKKVSTYVVDDLKPGQTYYIGIRTFTNAHDDQPNDVISPGVDLAATTDAQGEKVLLITYFAADNNLSSYIKRIVDRFRLGTTLNPNVVVVMLADAWGDNNTQVVTIEKGSVQSPDMSKEPWWANELDTADPEVLAAFLNFARSNYRADRTVVSLIGHGLALAPDLEWSEISASASVGSPVASSKAGDLPALPIESDFTPGDLTDHSFMSTVGMGAALLKATDNGKQPFDVIFFDQCFQGNLDTLYEIHQAADVFIASPTYGWLVAAYGKYVVQLTPSLSSEEMAQNIIDSYQGTLNQPGTQNDQHPNSIFWVRGQDIPKIANAVSTLGDKLTAAMNGGRKNQILQAALDGQFVDTTRCGKQNFELNPPDELVGAGSLARNLQVAFSPNDPFGVHNAAQGLLDSLAGIESRSLTGNPHVAPDVTWNYTDTITILAPIRPNVPPQLAWRHTVYRADVPFQVNWTVDPSQKVSVTSSFAFVRDHQWDEFLAGWYDDLTPTVGEWCHYMPPKRVIIEDVEPLSLTVEIVDKIIPNPAGSEPVKHINTGGQTALQLEWTETDDEDTTGYSIYSEGPLDLSWSLLATVPPTQTTLALNNLHVGGYRFAVLAEDINELFVAQSNQVQIEIPNVIGEGEPRIYLPALLR